MRTLSDEFYTRTSFEKKGRVTLTRILIFITFIEAGTRFGGALGALTSHRIVIFQISLTILNAVAAIRLTRSPPTPLVIITNDSFGYTSTEI